MLDAFRSSRLSIIQEIIVPENFPKIHSKTPVLRLIFSKRAWCASESLLKLDSATCVFRCILKNFAEKLLHHFPLWRYFFRQYRSSRSKMFFEKNFGKYLCFSVNIANFLRTVSLENSPDCCFRQQQHELSATCFIYNYFHGKKYWKKFSYCISICISIRVLIPCNIYL